MAFQLSPLPYERNALEPHVSRETLDFHHGKHHKTYVETLNKLIERTDYAGKKHLEDIIHAAKDKDTKVFNNAAQSWNHDFFWNSMKPGGGGKPSSTLLDRINEDFGGVDQFKTAFTEAATGQFGSGWAWLVREGDKLKVTSTPNAVPPFVNGQVPLLTCDVWEHAYYIDYRNERAKFVKAFLDSLVNWDFAAKRYQAR